MNDMNYFCTFTYDDKLHTEESFKAKLKNCLQYFSKKRGWKYMGVWERGGKTDRLHFHALMHIPKKQLTGKLEAKREYDFRSRNMKITESHKFFERKFGRNDFKEIPLIFILLTKIDPEVGFVSLKSKLIKLVLPLPGFPIIAFIFPGII